MKYLVCQLQHSQYQSNVGFQQLVTNSSFILYLQTSYKNYIWKFAGTDYKHLHKLGNSGSVFIKLGSG